MLEESYIDLKIKNRVISIKELHKALMKCKKSVLWKDSVANFHSHGLMRCYKLKKRLENGTYKISKYINFTIYEPKKREIVSTRFTDRVFQRSLCVNYLTHEIQKDFIEENYACQVGKGTHKAIKGFIRHLHSFVEEHGLNGYILKCDIHDYFGSTLHSVAKSSTDYVRDSWAKEHLHNIIDSFNGGDDPFKGMGLGSEITQSVQLAVLDKMDKLISKELGVINYIRYMDDFYLIHESKEYLQHCLKCIMNYMEERKLELSPNKTKISKLKQPSHFLGFSYQVNENGKISMKVLPEKIKRNKRKLRKLVIQLKLSREEVDKIFQCMLAHMKKSNNRSQVCKMIRYYENLWKERNHLWNS